MSDGVGSFSLLRCTRAETFILELYSPPAPTSDKYCLILNLLIYFDKYLVPRNHMPRHIFLQADTFWSEFRNYSKCSIFENNVFKYFKS